MKKPHKPIPSPRDLKGTIRRQPVVFAVYLVLRLIVLGTLVSSIIRGEYESAFICLLVFSLLYTPCIAAVTSVRRELGGKWAVGLAVWQCLIAWVVAFVAHGIGSVLL